MISTRSAVTIALLASFAGAPACASAPEQREQQLGDGFAAIQVEETRITEAWGRTEASGACLVRCAARHDICEASERLCAISRELEDADALSRCEQSRASCAGAAPDCTC